MNLSVGGVMRWAFAFIYNLNLCCWILDFGFSTCKNNSDCIIISANF